MEKMKVQIEDATDREAAMVFGEYSPHLPQALGYQVGALNGFQEGLVKSLQSQGSDLVSIHPVKYEGDPKFLKIGCPLFEGLRTALTYNLEVKLHHDFTYPPAHDDWLVEVFNRFVAVFAPEEDGQFLVMFVQSDPDCLDQLDNVEYRKYNYQKELTSLIGPFTAVATDITNFLIKGKPE